MGRWQGRIRLVGGDGGGPRSLSRMSLAQLRREGPIFTRPHRDTDEATWWPLEHASAAGRAAAEQTRETRLVEGCPEYGDDDVFLFVDDAVSS